VVQGGARIFSNCELRAEIATIREYIVHTLEKGFVGGKFRIRRTHREARTKVTCTRPSVISVISGWIRENQHKTEVQMDVLVR
jgi:hypothetical protein